MSAVVGLSAAWRRWVIENLRAGAAIEDVIDGLVAGGAPEIVARRETASIAETLVILAEEGRLERRLALTTRLGEDPPELPTFATLENDTFLREAWRPGLPALYPGLMTHLAPWTFEALEERFGDAQVTSCSGRPADPWCDRDWQIGRAHV